MERAFDSAEVSISRNHKLTEGQREKLSYTGTLTRVVKVCLVSTDNVTGVLLLAGGVHYGFYYLV